MGFGVKSEVGKVFSNHTHVALSSSLTIFILFLQLVEKLRCTLPLPNLFPSLARRFPFHFAPFGLDGLTEQSAKL